LERRRRGQKVERRRRGQEVERRRRGQKVERRRRGQKVAPQARPEGSQWQVRAKRARSLWIISQKRISPGGATDTRAVIFCRPFGPESIFLAIQGLHASRLPLATFWPRLRRYLLPRLRRYLLAAPAALPSAAPAALPSGRARGATF
jgi:hypothetical protein